MSEAFKSLFEQIRQYEEYQATYEEEAKRQEERLEMLEQARKETYDLVVSDNADDLARQRLDKNDHDVAALKKTINREQSKARAKLRTMRARILHSQELVVENLAGELEKRQQDLAELKSTLIPRAEEQLAELNDRAVQLDEEVRQLRKEIRKTSRLDLDELVV